MKAISINIELTQEDFESKEQLEWLIEQASYTNELYKEIIIKELNMDYFLYQANSAVTPEDSSNHKKTTLIDLIGILSPLPEEIKEEMRTGKSFKEIKNEALYNYFKDRYE